MRFIGKILDRAARNLCTMIFGPIWLIASISAIFYVVYLFEQVFP